MKKLTPVNTDPAKEFGRRMDRCRELAKAEIAKAVERVEKATAFLELLCSTADACVNRAYCSVLPWGETMESLRLWTHAAKAGKRKLDDREKNGKFAAEVLCANFFPESMRRGLKLVELSCLNWTADRNIFRFTRGKDRFELWAPNLDSVGAARASEEFRDEWVVFERYDKMAGKVRGTFNYWALSMYHVTEANGVTTDDLVAESYDPEEIRGKLREWSENEK